MKDEIKIFLGAIVAIFIGSLFALLLVHPTATSKFGNTTTGYAMTKTITGSVSLATGTSTIISLPDTDRNFAVLCNPDAVANEYLNFSNYTSTATSSAAAIGYATTTAGVIIFPKTCYTMSNQGNITWAQINGTTGSTSATSVYYMFGN